MVTRLPTGDMSDSNFQERHGAEHPTRATLHRGNGRLSTEIRASLNRRRRIWAGGEESFKPTGFVGGCARRRRCRSDEVTSWPNKTSPTEALRLIPLHCCTSDCRSHRTFLIRSPLTSNLEASCEVSVVSSHVHHEL